MGGKILAFDVDPSFGNCIDGLIVVDIARIDPRMPGRLMGRNEAVAYLDFHRSRRRKSA